VDVIMDVGEGLTEERLDLLCKKGLRYIMLPMAGIPPAVSAVLERPRFAALQLYNSHHNAQATAEMGIALLLATTRRVVWMDSLLRSGVWVRKPKGSFVLRGNTAVVVGYGNIGTRVATVLKALGMTVLAVRRTCAASTVDDDSGRLRGVVDSEDGTETFPPSALHAILPRASVLILCMPGTAATEKMVGVAELALLPAPACVVNLGRAASIDEDSLWDWLATPGACYGGDVWWQECAFGKEHSPVDAVTTADKPAVAVSQNAAHDFAGLRNVVMTPHCGGGMDLDSVEIDRAHYTIATLVGLAENNPRRKVDLAMRY
jgi:phosphoglycerate dehydrogenase-like enzyme